MSGQGQKARIVVVDDEPTIALTLAVILQRNGFDAAAFTHPFEALAEVRQRPPDLLITDVMMPGISGIDLAITLKKEHPECKILLFSGQAATAGLLKAAAAAGYDFELVSKPIHPADLLKKIESVTVA
jgi:CheY-like chemotaxis protein